jgi:hypothetical protein
MSKSDLRDVGPRPNPQRARAVSGGGVTGNKVKAVETRDGRAGRAHDAGTVSGIGIKQVRTEPWPQPQPGSQTLLGNEVAKDVGCGGPGAGRTVRPCGGQGKH